jgi:heptose I phosphotransferase
MPSSSTPLLLAAGLLLGLVGLLWSGRARRRARGFVEVHPRWRGFLRRRGLTEASSYLDLPGPHVSGHPGRSVARVQLTDGPLTINAYLKRESSISWPERLGARFGFASRSIREAHILQALEREGVGCPEWLAAGEDGRGRAFLLVRETPGTTELRAWLPAATDAAARLRLARSLGAALARMHAAGFSHPDLYSKHVLVGADGATVQFLDWQRACRGLIVDARRRARDLAALHATLADDLARPRERMACLHAYAAGLAMKRAARREFARLVMHHARRLLHRRHVCEKRQPALARGVQEWTLLHGGALCVTPALAEAWPGRSPEWLSPARQPLPPGQALMRRWLATADGPPALLVHRRRRLGMTDLWRWLCGRPAAPPEQREAELLLRLQRHAVLAPQVLAMGRRVAGGHEESFVLTRPCAGAVQLTAWLTQQQRRREQAARRRLVLEEAGALLRRLHDAACRLDGQPADALAVYCPPDGPPAVLVADAGRVAVGRRPDAGRAGRELAALDRVLTAVGCGDADRRRFLNGYRRGWAAAASHDRSEAAAYGLQGDSSMSASPPQAAAPLAAAGPNAAAESLWTRLFRGARRLRQQPNWPGFAGADWVERIMDVAVTDRFSAKQGRSTGRWILHANGPGPRRLAVYLKRHYRLPWWDAILATLWPGGGWSAAFREWDHLEWARAAGVSVPRAVAAAEFIGPGSLLRSVLAVEELADMLPLNEAVPLAAARLSPADFRRWKRGLIAEMARVTRLIHDRRRFHKDLYLCHFYVARGDAAEADTKWRGRVFLIDLHRLGRHPWTWMWWRMKDLAQLLYSSDVSGVDARDRMCFWRAYRGPGPRRRADRWLLRMVLFKWRRYRLHNERQKARGKR